MKETKSIQVLLEEYSAWQSSIDASDTMSLSEALDPQHVGVRLQAMGIWGTVALGKKREVMDAYLMLC